MRVIKNRSNHREIALEHGTLHVFANDEVFAGFGDKVYEMADNNLRIPRNHYFSYTPDAHVGIGTCIGTTAVWKMDKGFVSPSIVGVDIGCGMRVHLTSLHKDDLKDPRLKRKIIASIEKYVPTNERTTSNYQDIKLKNVIKDGLQGLPEYYIPRQDWLTHVESSRFHYDHSFLDNLPPQILKRAEGQIGTLGGGNHFIEIQHLKIDKKNWEIAKKWGLFNGQVVVMIHSGSRAWGAMLGREYTKLFKEYMAKENITNPDSNLIYAPIKSNEGEQYLNLMHSALNFAVTNRHMIAYGVLQGFRDVFGQNFEMPALYDLMHNYALEETHEQESMLVHRKGATKAVPAGHVMNPEPYKETGHPALIPGSMGTSSYIMVGEKGGEKNFYSICHGAGRLRSRRATKQLVTVDEFASSLRVGEEDEIFVNHRSLKSILDESPQAYKDVDQIIDSVVGAGLASVVAQCHPMMVIKGK